jgi:hypothetical protein
VQSCELGALHEQINISILGKVVELVMATQKAITQIFSHESFEDAQ